MNLYDDSARSFCFFVTDHAGQEKNVLNVGVDSTNTAYISGYNNKAVAYQEDTVPRLGGDVMSGSRFSRTVDNSELRFDGGTTWDDGGSISLHGKSNGGEVVFHPSIGTQNKWMTLYPDGGWVWDGQPVQTSSDQRLKQQIAEIDDKLLDAWEDVNLVQFKYNDAVETKGDKARLHTGYVVQQIQKACESHGVDISAYGLFCHEEYPEETEEVEVEQKDGTKTKERKVIREANEHYSLRYTEALIVECKYLRRCIERLEARLAQLENPEESQEKGADK
jgi:hypothetical protein